MIDVAWLWCSFIVICMALVSIGLMFSLVLRYASQLGDAERKLKASKQAHALDVQALTAKLQAAQDGVRNG